MKIQTFKHTGVLPNGCFIDRAGGVETKGIIRMSQIDGGCSLKGCHCSDGHWLMVSAPRTENGVVEGITIKFDSHAEMQSFLNNRELICR